MIANVEVLLKMFNRTRNNQRNSEMLDILQLKSIHPKKSMSGKQKETEAHYKIFKRLKGYK